jgi:hypothetical protein
MRLAANRENSSLMASTPDICCGEKEVVVASDGANASGKETSR